MKFLNPAFAPLAILALVLSTACGGQPTSGPGTPTPTVISTPSPSTPTPSPTTGTPTEAVFGEIVQSDQSRDMDPDVSDDTLDALVAGNTAFALDLYQQIRSGDGNLFYSPHSMSLALAMTWAGARENTATQMADTLHFSLDPSTLHPAFNALDLELASRADVAPASESLPFNLNIVNATWGQSGYLFLDPFLDTLAVDYGAAMRLVDYMGDTEGARQTINGWVAQETQDRIDELIPGGALSVDTRLVLVNAIYFSASWKYPFNPDRTWDGPFTRLDGSTVEVPMMTQDLGGQGAGYFDGEGYEAVEMPYDGDQLSMVLIAPDNGIFPDFEATFDSAKLAEILEGLSGGEINFTMPRFEFSQDLPLSQHLQALGMNDAFQQGVADLSGMDGGHTLYIQDVLHQAFVAVDEAGTEAAAATAVIIGDTSVPPAVRFDRPFVFLIRDIPTGAVLFMGRVVDPSSG